MTRPTIKSILIMIAEREGFSVRELLDRSRFTHIVRARQEAMYLCARDTESSMEVIARHMHRDHTTVTYGVIAHARRNGLPIPRNLSPQRWERYASPSFRAAA